MHLKFKKVDRNCKFKQRIKSCSCQGFIKRSKDNENKQDGGIIPD